MRHARCSAMRHSLGPLDDKLTEHNQADGSGQLRRTHSTETAQVPRADRRSEP